MKNFIWLLLFLMLAFGHCSVRADDKPRPSGPQTDGSFRKVILDAGSEITVEGKLTDSLKDPMEMAIAADGRVFYAERGGRVKMWTPKNRVTMVIGQIARRHA